MPDRMPFGCVRIQTRSAHEMLVADEKVAPIWEEEASLFSMDLPRFVITCTPDVPVCRHAAAGIEQFRCFDGFRDRFERGPIRRALLNRDSVQGVLSLHALFLKLSVAGKCGQNRQSALGGIPASGVLGSVFQSSVA